MTESYVVNVHDFSARDGLDPVECSVDATEQFLVEATGRWPFTRTPSGMDFGP